MVNIKYFGHSAFLVESGDFSIAIDPFITGNPVAKAEAKDIKCNYIIVTHAHGDHLGDAIELAKQNDALVIANNELANYLAKFGIKVHNMHIGGGFNFPFGRVKLTIAHHGSSDGEGNCIGAPTGVVLSIDGKNIYHCGDTGLFYDMKLIGEMNAIDLMLAPIGDNFTMGIDDAVKATQFVNPKMVVPMHYNTFPVIEVNPQEFKNKVEALNYKCKVMDINETITI